MKKIIIIASIVMSAVLPQVIQAQCVAPIINSFTPNTGFIGSTVTITGANFSSTPSSNQVFFGATQATVVSSSFGTLTVIVPVGATTALISVKNNCNLSAFSKAPFNGIFCPTPLTTTTYQNTAFTLAGIYGAYNMISQDMDLDGKPDIVCAGLGNGITIARNNSTVGNLNFIAYNFGFASRGISIADFDGDGKKDIGNSTDAGVFVARNTSTPGTITMTNVMLTNLSGWYQCGAADFNNDGKIDLCAERANVMYVFLNTSTGPGVISFASAVSVGNIGGRCTGIQCADVDGDGKSDILASQGGLNRSISLRNITTPLSGTLSFEAFEAWPSNGNFPYRCQIADFDKDGKIDLTTCNYNNPTNTAIYRNTSTFGDISFATAVNPLAPVNNYRIQVGDVNGDGLPDIVTKSLGVNVFSVYPNTSTGPGSITFGSRIDYTSSAQAEVSGIVIGDLDGDYVPDIATSGINSNTIRFHRNTSSQVDNTPPTAICKNITAALSPSGTVTVTANMINNGSSDACGLAPLLINGSASVNFTCANVGPNTVTLTVTDLSGNTSTCTAVVNVSPAAIIVSGQTTVCQGQTVNMSANLGDSYQWYQNGNPISGATSQTYVATVSGNYSVQVTNAGGCSGISDPIAIVVNLNPTVSITPSGSAFLCAPSNTAVITASESSTYQWQLNGNNISGATGQSYTATTAGSYQVQVIDLFGCTAISSAVVVSSGAPEVDVKGNTLSIVDGDITPSTTDATDFGLNFPSTSNTQTYTISNTGANALSVSNISISGANAANFTVGGITLPATVNASSSVTFSVTFSGTSIAVYNATVNVINNDCNESSYDFAIKAEISCSAPVFTTCPANIIANTATGTCNANVNYTSSVSGNPAPSLTYIISGVTTGSGSGNGSGFTFNKGVSNVVITATNSCGTVNCSFTVTVNDNEVPVIGSGAGLACVSHSYGLDGNYMDALAGPALVSNGGIMGTTNYTFSNNQGPSLSNAINPNTYSIQLKFTPDAVSGWRKLVDFKDRTSDNGLYIYNGALQFYPPATGPTNVFSVGTPVCVILTRDGSTNEVKGYVNGILQFTFTDNTGISTFTSAGNIIHILRDDLATGGSESTSGSLDDVKIFSCVLSSSEVAGMCNASPCMADITVNADANGCSAVVNYTVPVSDNCSGATLASSYPSGSAFPVGTTVVNLTATDASGNVSACSFNVNVTPSPLVGNITAITYAGGNNISCQGANDGSATVNVSGGCFPYTYNWTPSGGTNATATGLSAGNYSVTVTQANGMSTTYSITLTEPTVVTSSSTSGAILCNGGTTTVTVAANGGTAPYAGTGNFTVSAGTYNYTVTDANGCTSSTSIVATEPTVLTSTSSSGAILCNGGTTTVTVSANGGTVPYTGTGNFTVSAGTYNYTVTDANGCTSSTSIVVTEPTVLTSTSSSGAILCNGGTTTATVSGNGGTAPYTGDGIYTVGAGTHNYTVTDANGCTSSTSIIVTEPTVLTSNSTSGAILCNGGTTTVTVSANGGTAPYAGTGNFTVNAGTYNYTVTDANGCTSSTSIVVTEPTVLTSTSSSGAILCNGGTTTVTVSANGGTAPYTGTGNFTVSAGTYNYTVTDANGCLSSTSIVVAEPTAVTASIASIATSPLNTCGFGTAANIVIGYGGGPTSIVVDASASGGTGALTYSWLPISGLTNITNQDPTFTPTIPTGCSIFVLDLIVTDANGCTATASTSVNVANVRSTNWTAQNQKVNLCHSSASQVIDIVVSQTAVPNHLSSHCPDPMLACDCLGDCQDDCDMSGRGQVDFEREVGSGQLDLYPNPNNGQFFLDFVSVLKEEPIDVVIMDMLGKVVFAKTYDATEELHIDMNLTDELAAGLYNVKITNGEYLLVKKIDVKK